MEGISNKNFCWKKFLAEKTSDDLKKFLFFAEKIFCCKKFYWVQNMEDKKLGQIQYFFKK